MNAMQKIPQPETVPEREQEGKIQIQAFVPIPLHTQLKTLAALKRIAMKDLMTEALIDYVEKERFNAA